MKPQPISSRKGNTILYFYRNCLPPDWQPRYNLYEYRVLEVLCKKHDVIVAFFTKRWTRKPTKEIIPSNARYVLLPCFPTPKFLPRILALWMEAAAKIIRIALYVRATKSDLIFANYIDRGEAFCCARAGVHPLVAAAWGSDIEIEPERSRILRFFVKLTVRSADALVVDSEVHRNDLLRFGCNPSKIYSYPWGIDLTRFRPQDSLSSRRRLGWSSSKIVICTRNHHPGYGVEYIIRAMPHVLEQIRDTKLLMIGDGPLHNYYKSLVQQLGIIESVRFPGHVDNEDLPSLLNAADVYVSMSFRDGSSSSLMEALACGLPVVVSDIPGNREWIREGQNGFLVPPADSQALAVCIIRLLQEPKLRSSMSQANLALARSKADWDTNSKTLERCVDDMCEQTKYGVLHA